MSRQRRLTWKKHIFTKRKQLSLQLRKMYWLIGPKSELNFENKLLHYNAIFKPIWSYGIQLWGTASSSNIAIIQRFQSKILSILTNAPWFVTNEILHRDLDMPLVNEEIVIRTRKCRERILEHTNKLASCFMSDMPAPRRLKRKLPQDLPHPTNKLLRS